MKSIIDIVICELISSPTVESGKKIQSVDSESNLNEDFRGFFTQQVLARWRDAFFPSHTFMRYQLNSYQKEQNDR